MLLSRRQMIEAGAAAGALALHELARRSPQLGRRALRPARSMRPTRPPPVPARPRVSVDPVIDPRLVARARASFDRHRASLGHIDVVGIVDFTQASSEPRFYLLDTNSGRVTRHLVAHGRGSDPAHTGFLQRFSNQVGSEASSNGAYVDRRLIIRAATAARCGCAGSITATATPRRGRSSSIPPGMPSPTCSREQRPARPQRRLLRAVPYQPAGSAGPPRPRPLPLRRPPRLKRGSSADSPIRSGLTAGPWMTLAVEREARAVAGAVPGPVGLVPADQAAHMGADRRDRVERARSSR